MSRLPGPSGPDWRDALEAVHSAKISQVRGVAGGDIGDSRRVEFESGEAVFLKLYPTPEPSDLDGNSGLGRAEANGLAWLARTETLRVAQVIAWDEDWLALEWIESARPATDYDERLGVGLAELHRANPDRFGFAEGNWIGRLPQDNRAESSWAEFYRERRLRPLLDRARGNGALTSSLRADFERLFTNLEFLVGPEEAPARLHGDLWAGNVLPDESGQPCLIDPSVYGGHREMDLAMMRLFGGFSARVFECYAATHPLADGSDARIALYQLYPLLVHVCLFGGSYVAQLERSIEDALCAD